MNSKLSESGKVQLEDLLRWKRQEMPGDDFWQQFNGQVKQEALRTVVQKRSWRESFAFFFSAFSPRYFAVPAMGVFILCLGLWHYQSDVVPVSVPSPQETILVNKEVDAFDATEVVLPLEESTSELDAMLLADEQFALASLPSQPVAAASFQQDYAKAEMTQALDDASRFVLAQLPARSLAASSLSQAF